MEPVTSLNTKCSIELTYLKKPLFNFLICCAVLASPLYIFNLFGLFTLFCFYLFLCLYLNAICKFLSFLFSAFYTTPCFISLLLYFSKASWVDFVLESVTQ